MRQLSLEEIENLDNGEIIPSFTARIKKVFPQKTGENSKGTWFLQNMIVTDGSKEITVTWGEENRFDKWEGREMIFESSDTNHGKQGLKWEVRNVGDKTYKGVKVTGAAKIREVGDSPSPVQRQSDVREQGNWQERAEIPREDRITTGAQLENPTDEVRKVLNQAINGFVLALEGMRAIAARYERDHLGEELPKEQQQAICSSLFIYLDRKGEIGKLPSSFVLGEYKVPQSIREGADRILNQIEEHGVVGHN